MALRFRKLAVVEIVNRNSICFGINRLLQTANTFNWQEVPLNFSGSTAFAQKDTPDFETNSPYMCLRTPAFVLRWLQEGS